MHKSHLQMTEDYVQALLAQRTPQKNTYHNLAHTQNVVSASIEIGTGEHLNPEEMDILQIAAWFHDTGYIEKSSGHEEISAMFASNFLSENGYPHDRIDKIVKCILATKVPQNPKSKLENILCDADLHHLGKKYFFEQNDKFRPEFEYHKGRKLTEYEWLVTTIDFATRHRFFSDYAVKNFSGQKDENIKILLDQLEKLIHKP